MARNSKVQHKGGGWYKVPGVEKPVRGREAVALAIHEQEEVAGLRGLDRKSLDAFSAANALSPSLTGRLNFLREAGLLYRGIRDVFTAAGYIQEGSETFDHYWSLYERDPVAGRIVDMPAKTTWKTPPEVFEGEKEKEKQTDFERDWEVLTKRLKVWRHFERVDRLSRIGRYAILLIGVRDTEDRELITEMPNLTGSDDVLYLTSYAEKYAEIKEWDSNPKSPRFGLPILYDVNISSGVKEFRSAGNLKIHHSRVIHVAEDALVDDVFGRPVLKRVLNALADLLKVTASTGEAYWQMAARILQAKIDPMMELSSKQVTAMGEDIEALVHDLRRQFVGHGVELQWLPGTEPKPSDALDVYVKIMGVGSGIPARVLFGSEQGQLASAQDERNFFGMVNARQEQHAEPDILRTFIDRLVGVKGLAAPGQEGYEVVWPTLFEQTEQQIAEANKARAETAKSLTPLGGDPRDLVEIDEERNVWLVPREPQPEEEDLEGSAHLEDEEDEGELEFATQVLLTNLAGNQTKVQTLIFPKEHWDSQAVVKAWAKDHDFKSSSVDVTEVSYRLRQRAPGDFQRLRTICLKGAKRPTSKKCTIKAVVGPLKKK